MRQPRQLNTTNQFEKEVFLAKKRGKDLAKLRSVIDLLLHRAPLPNKLRDHGLQGQYQNYRDLHIEPDWLLIYRANAEELWLVRTGVTTPIYLENRSSQKNSLLGSGIKGPRRASKATLLSRHNLRTT